MKIGIIGAMEVEVATLKSNMTVKNTVKKASMEFYEGTIGNTDVVVVRSGIGKVNAGICVQILIELCHLGSPLLYLSTCDTRHVLLPPTPSNSATQTVS